MRLHLTFQEVMTEDGGIIERAFVALAEFMRLYRRGEEDNESFDNKECIPAPEWFESTGSLTEWLAYCKGYEDPMDEEQLSEQPSAAPSPSNSNLDLPLPSTPGHSNRGSFAGSSHLLKHSSSFGPHIMVDDMSTGARRANTPSVMAGVASIRRLPSIASYGVPSILISGVRRESRADMVDVASGGATRPFSIASNAVPSIKISEVKRVSWVGSIGPGTHGLLQPVAHRKPSRHNILARSLSRSSSLGAGATNGSDYGNSGSGA